MLGPTVLGNFPAIQLALFPDRGIFLGRTLHTAGMIWHVFAIGVKTNISVLMRGRKALLIGFSGLIFSMTVVIILFLLLGGYAAHHFAGGSFFWPFVAVQIASTPLAVIHRFLSDFQLVNTEAGRLALSIGVLNDAVGIVVMLLVNMITASGHMDLRRMPFEFATLLLLTLVCVFVVRPLCFWLIGRTPEGKPVAQGYVVTILLVAFNLAILLNLIGSSAVQGALIMGLAIPSGPPLGATLVERLETVNRNLMLPMVFLAIGQRLNLFAVTDWTGLWVVVFIAAVGRLSKMVGTVISALSCRIPLRQAFAVGLILVARGLVDTVPYFMWESRGVGLRAALQSPLQVDLICVILQMGPDRVQQLVDPQSYAAFVMVGLGLTMVASPIVRSLSNQSRIYRPHVRRTIQHSKPHTEFRVLVCIHEKDNVPSIITVLQLANATRNNPVCVYVLHLVELLGRATPILIAHKPNSKITSGSLIFNAFHVYARRLRGNLVVQPLTSIAPYKTMHDDVCSVALQKQASLIILPFHKQQLIPGSSYLVDGALQIINPNVLDHAPCSVALLVDRGGFGAAVATGGDTGGGRVYKAGVLFFGGPDDREALSYAGRMAEHPSIFLVVVRFIAVGFGIEATEETKLDAELVGQVRLKIMGYENVSYQEITVHNGEEAVSALCSMNEAYDLMVVGRKQRFGLELAHGLSIWSENPELGVIGDFCCSPDFFGGSASVLVVQQQARAAADVEYWE
ncbi:hypothetical protein ACLOJK_031364 [Asimina triloba]